MLVLRMGSGLFNEFFIQCAAQPSTCTKPRRRSHDSAIGYCTFIYFLFRTFINLIACVLWGILISSGDLNELMNLYMYAVFKHVIF